MSTVLLDLEALLAPIAGDSAVGPDLHHAPLFDKINELRTTDDPGGAVDESVGRLREGQARVADWGKVITQCKDALATKTKDLTLVTYLSEALAREHGLQGVHDSIALLKGVHERYWPEVHPQIVENDLEPRAMWLERFDRLVQKPLAAVELTAKVDGEAHAFWEWANAQHKGEAASKASPETRDELTAEAAELQRVLANAVEKTPRKFYEGLETLVKSSQELLDETRTLVEQQFNAEPGVAQLEDPPPNFSSLRKALEELQYKIEDLLRTKPAPLEEQGATEETAAVASGDGAAPVRGAGGSGGPVQSRADALRRLSEIAAFFQRTEPHSPVSFLVQRAVRWGEMPLDRWLDEVVGDESVLYRIRETLGIKRDS